MSTVGAKLESLDLVPPEPLKVPASVKLAFRIAVEIEAEVMIG